MLTQDCAALVLGYYPISLWEKDRCRFHLSRVGNAGDRLLQSNGAPSRQIKRLNKLDIRLPRTT